MIWESLLVLRPIFIRWQRPLNPVTRNPEQAGNYAREARADNHSYD